MGLHGFGGGGKLMKEGHGRKLIGALYSGRDAGSGGDIVRERDCDDGGGSAVEGVGHEWEVGRGGEDSDCRVAAE